MDEPGDFERLVGGVAAFQWNPLREHDGRSALVNNVGDLLGPLVVELMLERLDPTVRLAQVPARRVLSVGSVLHLGRRRDVVWGSGLNGKADNGHVTADLELDVRAVRGPLTAAFLRARGVDVPEVYGDPALLLPELLPELVRWTRVKRWDVLVAPNLNDRADLTDDALPAGDTDGGTRVLDPTDSVRSVLRTIAQSRIVVGSSLHAVVVADALGIPARFVASAHEDPLKYRDYLAGTGRAHARIARDVPDALALGGHGAPSFDRDALVASFPRDVWGLGSRLRTVHGRPIPTAEFPDEVLRRVPELVAGTLDVGAATTQLVDELLPRAIDAALADGPEADALVAGAATFRDLVVPEPEPAPEGTTAHLLDLVDERDARRLALEVRLAARGLCAEGRADRPTGSGRVLSLSLECDRVTGGIGHLDLVLVGPGRQRSVVAVPRSPFHRRQWHLDLDVLVPASATAGAGPWEVRLAVTDVEDQVHEIPVARPGTLGLGVASVRPAHEVEPWTVDGTPAAATA